MTKPSQRKRKARRQSGYLRSHDKQKNEEKQKARKREIHPIKCIVQRIAIKHKKAFFNEQYLIIEENKKRGKARDLFRKIVNIKGEFCPKLCTIKDKNSRDLVDTEEIKMRWKEYMEEMYKKDLPELDYYDGVVSYPEPDTLQFEVKWALRSPAVNNASGCHEIPAELFKSLKDDSIKFLHSLYQQIWKTQKWPQYWKRSVLIPIPKKGRTKEFANHQTKSHSFSILVRACLKCCMLGFSITCTKNFQMSKLGLEKEEELEIKLPTFS